VEVDYVVVAEPVPEPEPERVPEPAAELAPALSAGVPVDENEPERTPNGLRRRVPREHRPRPVPALPRPRAELSRPVTDSPGAVGARITQLRDGIERGHASASVRDRSARPHDLGGLS
jgi:hypothetical protein